MTPSFPSARRLGLLLLLPALAFSTALPASAQAVRTSVDTGRSTLSYTGRHPLHSFTGVSSAVRGTLEVDPAHPAQSRIEIVVPVESFDSGNSNRDSNMLDVVEADRHPDVRFVSEAVTVEGWEPTSSGYAGRWMVRGPLTFHGRTHPVEIPVDVKIDGGAFEARAAFPVSLDRFGVKRPSLLLMRIDDTIDLEGAIYATLGTDAAAR